MDDEKELEKVGYSQELKRTFSLWSMIGFCFSIVGCWAAISGSLSTVMVAGGPVVLFWGWMGVGGLSMFVALSMAEICSSFPVCGGQYSWVLFLGMDRRWGRVLSYVTACIQMGGLNCMGSTALYMVAQYCEGMIVLRSAEGTEATNWHVVLIAWALLFGVTMFNIFCNWLQHYVSSFALFWSLFAFVLSSIVVLAVNDEKQTGTFVFTQFVNDSGWTSVGMVVIIGIMQSAYGMCTYDAPAHMCEELAHASRDAPRAIVICVVIGFITGVCYILVLMFSIHDVEDVATTPTDVAILEIFYQATASKAGAIGLQTLVMMCQVFASNALLVENSRSVYALARDGAFPKFISDRLRIIHPGLDVPIWAIVISATFEAIWVAILFGSTEAFFTVLSVATIGLYISYLIPIAVAIFRRNQLRDERFYSLGKWGLCCNITSSIYLLFCSIFFFFPSEMPATASNMNYACVAFGIIALLGLLCWFGGGRKYYAVEVMAGASEHLEDNVEIDREKIPASITVSEV